MRIFELMTELGKLPAGTEVKVDVVLEESMELFKKSSERMVYARIVGYDYQPIPGIIYLGTRDTVPYEE